MRKKRKPTKKSPYEKWLEHFEMKEMKDRESVNATPIHTNPIPIYANPNRAGLVHSQHRRANSINHQPRKKLLTTTQRRSFSRDSSRDDTIGRYPSFGNLYGEESNNTYLNPLHK
jgi:hypothetical protein